MYIYGPGPCGRGPLTAGAASPPPPLNAPQAPKLVTTSCWYLKVRCSRQLLVVGRDIDSVAQRRGDKGRDDAIRPPLRHLGYRGHKKMPPPIGPT